jgi:nitrite reductase/ring-hydroxylating ferredoxin subunit
MGDISRRAFVALTIGGLASCAGGWSLAGEFDAGDAASIPEGYTDTFARDKHVMIVRKGKRVWALSSVCTHQGFTIRVVGEGAEARLRCPGHGSRFDSEGNPTGGPARGQLGRHGVRIEGGKLLVNPDKIFLPGEFEQPGSFVEMN